jgi:Zn-dependent peptidase ImmA (M78 family)/transcriptional regulator with XRE-family HTH domain
MAFVATLPRLVDVKTHFKDLQEVREQLVCMSLDFVSRRSGIDSQRLAALERGETPATVEELERLAGLYGVEADLLEYEPIELAPGDGVACLTSAPEFRDIGDAVRAKIIAAASAARDLVRLETMLGSNGLRWDLFPRELPRWKPLRDRHSVPFKEGARYAQQLRSHLGLGENPIPSLHRLIRESFSTIIVLHSRLGVQGPAGLAFVDRLRGPTIVLNSEGKNENPCVRRVSLAHELCHLLIDWSRQEPLAMISGHLDDSGLEVERRANAFAIRLLCPESVIARLTREIDRKDIVRVLAALSPFGLPYAAIRLYLKNQAGWDLPLQPEARYHQYLDYQNWASDESEAEVDHFPLGDVPLERRTHIARLAAEAFSRGLLTRASFAGYLGVSSLVEVERVLDHLGLDRPHEAVA